MFAPLAVILTIVVNGPLPSDNDIDWVEFQSAYDCQQIARLVEGDIWEKIVHDPDWRDRTAHVSCETKE